MTKTKAATKNCDPFEDTAAAIYDFNYGNSNCLDGHMDILFEAVNY